MPKVDLGAWAQRVTAPTLLLCVALTAAVATERKRPDALTKLTPAEAPTSMLDGGQPCEGGACRTAAESGEKSEVASRIAVRTYYADLKFEASPTRDAEVLAGNCLNQRLKIVVSPTFDVTWEMREGTRRTRWRGTVNSQSGVVMVVAPDVALLDADGIPVKAEVSAEVRGDFAKSRIAFGPCGTGEIIVRN